MLLYIQSYHSWKIVVNNVYTLWLALASSVCLLLTTLFSKISREEESVLVERIFDNERSWNYYYLIVEI